MTADIRIARVKERNYVIITKLIIHLITSLLTDDIVVRRRPAAHHSHRRRLLHRNLLYRTQEIHHQTNLPKCGTNH